MSLFSKYEKRFFIFLGISLIWILYWAFATWAVGEWYGLPVRDGIFMWLGLLMLVGFVDLMLLAVGNLIIGQWKWMKTQSKEESKNG